MIRVGDDFYLTGTTMHSVPGLPILHSRDLVNWRFVSCAATELDLGPEFRLESGEVYGQGLWAPSFRYHDGIFHIFSNQPLSVGWPTDRTGYREPPGADR